MLRKRIVLGFCGAVSLSLMMGTDVAHAAESYYVDSASLRVSPSMPRSVVDDLNQQGWLLYTENNGLKEPICEIFLAKSVAAENAAAASGKMRYSSLKLGVLVGVIHLLPEAVDDYSADFHNQKLKPGYYTMRYAVMPAGTYENGPELGEFVVLSLARMDRDPGRILKMDELAHLSASSSGLDIAPSMQLVNPDTNIRESPKVTENTDGACLLQVRLQLDLHQGGSKELPLAIHMLSPVPHPEGS